MVTPASPEQGGLPWLAEPLARILDHPAHALLVVGSPGVGAFELQLTLAQAWLCEGGPKRPCGQCGSCHLVGARSHPDLLVLLPEAQRVALGWEVAEAAVDGGSGKRKPSRQIRIGEVRAAIDWATKTNSRGRAKVLVLHPAEAMNPQSANALLKTLEEPPAGVRLLLSCSDPEHLLPTVRSRCQRIVLPAPAPDVAAAWLRGHEVDEPETLLAACSGRPLDALAMARAGVDGAAWRAIPAAVAAGRADALAGWSLAAAIDALQKVCHDAMVIAAGGAGHYFPSGAVAGGADLGRLAEWSALLARAARVDEHPFNEALQIESLLLRGRECWRRTDQDGDAKGRRFATLRA